MDQNGRRRESGDVARELIEAAFRGDVAAATALCAPDVVLRIEGIQEVFGHDGVAQVIEFNGQVSSDVRVEIHRILSSGDTAAINRTTYLTIGGQRIELGVGSFFTVRDGLVCEWSDYQDMVEVTRALGH
ncbi:nuclear transport factor 2 family protein [Rhodococcus sp. IEGM 1408]|uniref:nuclear transport factor 2 family protein n=1 Tax=Rhodococcus sp. IEGM 1408 TaxID=3082220 RepID=UPI002953A743|nr:nuclear transport factor 2 family protein [Rhodococcus sp. IEGM 1408]MDV8002447.1 nuclear transport factor 2 family protein [Rhodococcus sp. IEGM 1408]